ncbi:ATP-binding cassette domain-containing protein [Alicyclobacillus acidoterrestris]|uniref:ATP-binding cassette domain-containing protein n=1 Tax=Alicyclobacillus acidoterrestris (strain ATCC 49025 / DSM 3922 / CIP 106132 / NCIMB 13137 / GD3B) TaxID=1356854 RepID=T0CZG2_ALIAG|nr:ATP-binding cassette domain-containing protein [Alicyclobacillus acidoterrestris]EPZ44687.1 hypothetical protein N007_10645 [Alicyclobacillus acidoterrestris ATCC 49025]UNO50298.1 ATP-binding cassette domain-containing protein [Alicyclobacillus acidoterrestris]
MRQGLRMRLDDICKEYDNQPVLHNIDLSIEPGEFVAIVGRSGGGKSTLLRLVSGLESASSGKIVFDETEHSGIHHDIRVLFQESRILPWKTVEDNVLLGMEKPDRRRAKEVLTQVGLESKGESWPHTLSGGQRQRVALARALVAAPKMLLLDEPLGALDALTKLEMQRLIEDMWKIHQFTVLIVTHDIQEAVTLADRVILIEHGMIAMDMRIPLDRPRVKDTQFLYYENTILERFFAPTVEQHSLDFIKSGTLSASATAT